MDAQEILQKLTVIFRETFDNPDVEITSETTAADIDEWDSLTHIQLVVAIEKAFGVKFSASDIYNWKQVGDMVQSIASRKG